MSNVVLNILSEFKGKKAFADADKAVASLSKTIKSLGGAYALTATGAALFAKNSIQAFIADESAANKLQLAVKNLGLEFANPYITEYISNLEKTSKVADDELRPAFQSLIQQTGSLAKSQSILSTAIEVSRGSGESLSTVVYDLNQAYVGNTKGLKKYYLGLSNAALQAASFTEIQKIMNSQFSGSSAAYLSTYSGQVGVLSLAWNNFQETVGGTLLTLASFGDGSEGAKLNVLAWTLDKIGAGLKLIADGKEAVTGLFDVTGKNGILSKFNPTGIPTGGGKPDTSKSGLDKYAEIMKQIEKDRKKYNDAILKNQKQMTAEQKKQAALKKAGTIFDLEQANLIAALKKNLSEDDRKRAELQLSLLTGNLTEAERLVNELAKSQGLGKDLAAFLANLPNAKNPFEAWKAYLDELEKQIARISGGGTPTPSPTGNVPTMPIASPAAVLAQASADFAAANNQIRVIVEGGDEVTSLMRFKIQEAAQSGSTTNWSQTVGAWDR